MRLFISALIAVTGSVAFAYPRQNYINRGAAGTPSAAIVAPAPRATPVNISVCFSPNEGCDRKLIDFVNAAQSRIDMAIYNFTLPGLEAALQQLKSRGIQIRIVADKQEASSKNSLIANLAHSGFNVRYGNVQGIFHNKFTVVDGRFLETGSFNYTTSATQYNAENQIYLDDQNTVNQYQAEFEKQWQNSLPFTEPTPNAPTENACNHGDLNKTP